MSFVQYRTSGFKRFRDQRKKPRPLWLWKVGRHEERDALRICPTHGPTQPGADHHMQYADWITHPGEQKQIERNLIHRDP